MEFTYTIIGGNSNINSTTIAGLIIALVLSIVVALGLLIIRK